MSSLCPPVHMVLLAELTTLHVVLAPPLPCLRDGGELFEFVALFPSQRDGGTAPAVIATGRPPPCVFHLVYDPLYEVVLCLRHDSTACSETTATATTSRTGCRAFSSSLIKSS